MLHTRRHLTGHGPNRRNATGVHSAAKRRRGYVHRQRFCWQARARIFKRSATSPADTGAGRKQSRKIAERLTPLGRLILRRLRPIHHILPTGIYAIL